MKLSEERSGLCWLFIGQEPCMYCDMCVCVCVCVCVFARAHAQLLSHGQLFGL